MKHAYLIIAHNEFNILEKTIELLDDERNDIYIHIDKKVKNFDFDKFKNIAKKSKIYFTKRTDVRWGTHKQIYCELLMLDEATKRGQYEYYHLISGVDFPIATQDEIHKFFAKNKGKEFLHYASHSSITEGKLDRIRYHHLFGDNLRVANKIKVKIAQKLHSIALRIQKLIKYDRIKNKKIEFRSGANWFSITDELARYVVSKQKEIKKDYKNSYCADEVFLQTIVYNSKFYDKLWKKIDDDHSTAKRCIDWNRGGPYTWKLEDYDEIMSSGNFFVRKVTTKDSEELIEKIYKTLKK